MAAPTSEQIKNAPASRFLLPRLKKFPVFTKDGKKLSVNTLRGIASGFLKAKDATAAEMKSVKAKASAMLRARLGGSRKKA